MTDSSGVATAPAFTANSQAGSYTVTASVVGVASLANFSLTNIPGAAANITTTAGTPQSAIVNTAFTTALQVTVRDSGNNLVNGATVTFTTPASGASAKFGASATASAVTGSNGIATAPALTANNQGGTYSVTATVPGAATPATFSLTNTTGTLSGAVTSTTTTVNLTTEGVKDWVHWGDASLNRKTGVAAQISTYSVVGTGSVVTYTNDPRGATWTDGTPTVSSTNNKAGISITGTNNGFSITVPAGTTVTTLSFHVGGTTSGATLTAHLSDGSAADYTNVVSTTSGQYDRNYTLIFSGGSAGRTLTVTWKMTSGTGSVTLSGAALQ